MAAFFTLAGRVVFEKLNGGIAFWAFGFENSARFPVHGILSRAFHGVFPLLKLISALE
jgi:hypothetical protein